MTLFMFKFYKFQLSQSGWSESTCDFWAISGINISYNYAPLWGSIRTEILNWSLHSTFAPIISNKDYDCPIKIIQHANFRKSYTSPFSRYTCWNSTRFLKRYFGASVNMGKNPSWHRMSYTYVRVLLISLWLFLFSYLQHNQKNVSWVV
jgi:hypothetical protein